MITLTHCGANRIKVPEPDITHSGWRVEYRVPDEINGQQWPVTCVISVADSAAVSCSHQNGFYRITPSDLQKIETAYNKIVWSNTGLTDKNLKFTYKNGKKELRSAGLQKQELEFERVLKKYLVMHSTALREQNRDEVDVDQGLCLCDENSFCSHIDECGPNGCEAEECTTVCGRFKLVKDADLMNNVKTIVVLESLGSVSSGGLYL